MKLFTPGAPIRNAGPSPRVIQGMSTMTPAHLTAWIEDLRGRLERGEFADIGPLLIEPFYEVLDLERWVRFTLLDVDRWQTFDAGMKAAYYYERMHTARRLRELSKRLHGQLVTAEEIEAERGRRERDCGFGEVG
jgi:hypothetical protein